MKLYPILLSAFLFSSCVEVAPEIKRKTGEEGQLSVSKCKAVKKSLEGNFSGIAWLGGDDYIVIDDSAETEGFYRFTIRIDAKGEIESVDMGEFVSSGIPYPDAEGVEYYPSRKTVFIAEESTNETIELSLETGKRTGRALPTQATFPLNYNSGLESLSYNTKTRLFWVTSETTLPDDGESGIPENGKPNILRIQSYGEDLKARGSWLYTTEKPSIPESGDIYAMGVSDICALDDGRLLIMERESNMKGYNGFCNVSIYIADPTSTEEGGMMDKELLITLNSDISSFANYEGMCLGPTIGDGRRVLVLVSDSQANYRGAVKDWFLTIKLGGL